MYHLICLPLFFVLFLFVHLLIHLLIHPLMLIFSNSFYFFQLSAEARCRTMGQARSEALCSAWDTYLIIFSYYHTIILSYYHTIILSYYHTIILSYYHTIILSYYHTIIFYVVFLDLNRYTLTSSTCSNLLLTSIMP